ncbi:MAG: acetoin utilization protein acuB [Flavobacteriaceae bacterium]|nr:acetoin utilization protein acuB [Flavobacteriaceae bacterium]
MNLSELIINDIKPVGINQKIRLIQQLFNNLTYSHIPICLGEEFIGCISENDIHCFESELTIKDCQYAVELFSVNNTTNWLDVLEAFAQNSTNVMPVLQEGEYVGYYELKDIISLFDQAPFFYEPGAVLVVRKEVKEYSFSEISQIVESNNAKVLGVFLSKFENDTAEITVKINNTGLTDIIQTFIRYGYEVVAGHEEESYVQDLKDRSDYLKKYLDI